MSEVSLAIETLIIDVAIFLLLVDWSKFDKARKP